MASKYDGAEITVSKWNEYNPRGDSKYPQWFRMQNDIMAEMAETNCEQFVMWVHVMCEASKKNGQPFKFKSASMKKLKDLSEQRQDQALEMFLSSGSISISRTDSHGVAQARTDSHLQTDRQTDEQTDKQTTSAELKKTQLPASDNFLTLLEFVSVKGLLSQWGVKTTTQRMWLDCYSDAVFITQEIKKAAVWLEVNPKKRPKQFPKFMTAWLSRAWEPYRKTLPSNRPTKSMAEILGETENADA